MIQRWRTLPPYWRRTTLRLAAVPLLWILITIGIFAALYVLPDDDPAIMIAGQGATEEQLEDIRADLGLHGSRTEQYLDWIGGMLTGDFGEEFRTERPIRDGLKRRLPPTAELLLVSMAAVGAINSLAAWLTRMPRHTIRTAAAIAAAALAAIPLFVGLTMYILEPARWWSYVPPVGGYVSFLEDPWNNTRLIIFAAMVPALVTAGLTVPIVLGHARAQPSRSGLFVTWTAATLAALPLLLSSTILVERVMSVGGVGEWLFIAAFIRDLTVLRTLVALLCLVALVAWAVAPRIAPLDHSLRSPPNRGILTAGTFLVAAFVLAALVLPPFLDDPRAFNISDPFSGPSWDHPLGTTQIGQDVLARAVSSIKRSLSLTIIPLVAGLVPGVLVALAVRHVRQPALAALAEAAGAWHALPLLPLVLVLVITFDPGLQAAVVAVTIGAFVTGLALGPSFGSLEFSQPADRTGMALMVLGRATSVAFTTILAMTTLSWVGLGVEIGTPDFGADINVSAARVSEYSHLVYGPALVLTALLFSFLLIRTALDDLDPPRPYER